MKIDYSVKTDVLIIGAGGAGIKASIKAAENDAQVLLVTKCSFGRTGATFYPGTIGWGMNAILFPGDSVDHFTEEIIDAAAGTVDKKLARILAEQCTDRFHELEGYGLKFNQKADGTYNGVIPCFGKRMRGSATYGLDIIRKTLWEQLMVRGVEVRTGIHIISLVVDNGVCLGAVGIDEQDDYMFIQAKSVIISTGGACGIYKYSLATDEQTGDGYIMALDAGARTVNMEFIQFIPGITWPVKKMLFQEKNLDTFPSFTNKNGEDILTKYLPKDITIEECLIERAKHGPFSTATISRYVDIAMYEEWRIGNATKTGGIHLQYAPKVLSDDRWVITKWLEWMQSKGIDVVGQGFDMIPHAQCFNGGIYIDENCSTGIKGLFAAGETAGGPHGADRLGGAAMAGTQVFGAIAGTSAAKWAKESVWSEVSFADIETRFEAKVDSKQGGMVHIPECMEEIRNIMWECAAIARNEERCINGLSKIKAIESRFNPLAYSENGKEMREAMTLYSYIKLAKMLLEIIKFRKESRGPHYRIDYPVPDKEFEGMIAVKEMDGGFSFEILKT
jgi:succinate dehydrogenase/fumarate reductase flavoprotein subunit